MKPNRTSVWVWVAMTAMIAVTALAYTQTDAPRGTRTAATIQSLAEQEAAAGRQVAAWFENRAYGSACGMRME